VTLVLVETDGGQATEVSLEALTFARGLGERGAGGSVQAVVVGAEPGDGLLAELGAQGVEQVHVATDARLAAYSAAAWAAALVEVARSTDAGVLLASGSPRGNEVLAHVAVRCGVAMAANVVAVDAVPTKKGDPLVVSRQVVGGSVLEEMRLSDELAVLSIAGHACEPAPAGTPTIPGLAEVAVTLTDADLVARVVRTGDKPVDESAALTSARVVVGAGRGAGNADGFADLIAGGGPGGGPRVSVFNGKELLTNVQTRIADFFAGDVNNRGGIRVTTKNLDGDGRADIVTGAGTGAGTRVTGYLGRNLAATGTPTEAFGFDAFTGLAGVFVG